MLVLGCQSDTKQRDLSSCFFYCSVVVESGKGFVTPLEVRLPSLVGSNPCPGRTNGHRQFITVAKVTLQDEQVRELQGFLSLAGNPLEWMGCVLALACAGIHGA